MIRINNKKLITAPPDAEITPKLIKDAIKIHRRITSDYLDNERLYMSRHDILVQKDKEPWKPDNRLVINYAKYIVDTFGGYHLGIPLKVSHEVEHVDEFIRNFRQLNDMEDSEFELAKLVDIFGHAFIYVYQDEDGNTRMTYNSPVNMLIVHDDSIQERPLFAVRYQIDVEEGYGEVITADETIAIKLNKGYDVVFGEVIPHVFSKLPVIEMIENDERQGLFDSVKTLINALNKAASEKANDVDYFADAYLKIIGTELDDDAATKIRDNRILNLYGEGNQLDAAFLEKPNADTTQQNLIELLKESIFAVSMVANLSEQDFGNASGTALAFKLHAMSNLAKVKDRKMQSALSRMYEVVFSVPMAQVGADDWKGISYQFTRNVPRNVLEEAQIVAQLDGQVSDETKLTVLSIVDDVKTEMDKIEKETQKSGVLSQQMAKQERLTDSDVIANE